MKFVKTDDLVKGMRLARPIYNRNGVLLYDRDTKLTRQGIVSIKNFNLIGIYVLEPTEPLPPMTKDDIEFERFITMSVFGLREDIELLSMEKEPKNVDKMVDMIYNQYASKDVKISTMKNIRSKEDYMYRHGILAAILTAAIGIRIKLTETEIKEVIMAALVQGIGYPAITSLEYISNEVKIILDYENKLQDNKNVVNAEPRKLLQAKALMIANVYDDRTAMKLGKEPASEVATVKHLMKHTEKYDDMVVGALVESLRMLYAGVCVELTNKAKGIVILGNEDNALRPVVLGFNYNEIYNLMQDDVYKKVQIKDIMKSMDRRVKIEKETIDEYLEKYSNPAEI